MRRRDSLPLLTALALGGCYLSHTLDDVADVDAGDLCPHVHGEGRLRGNQRDVNGDGYDDLLMGGGGEALLYLGGPAGITFAETTMVGPDGSGSNFGDSLALTDVDGDGFADAVIGADDEGSGMSVGTAGRVYAFGGSTIGAAITPTTRLASPDGPADGMGAAVAPAGDVDGDGYADVLVADLDDDPGVVHLYLGGAAGLAATPVSSVAGPYDSSVENAFGDFVAGAGDVNGDGHADVIVGAFDGATNAGVAHLYLGSARGIGPAADSVVRPPYARMTRGPGLIVASAGDVNGDGLDDVIVADRNVSLYPAQAYLYLGSSCGLAALPAATLAAGVGIPEPLTLSVAGAGDVNHDGYDDVIIGVATLGGTTGTASVFLGSAAGLDSTSGVTLAHVDDHGLYGGEFGSMVIGAGDVNGDGYDDVVVGSPEASSFASNAYVYLGSAAGITTSAAIVLHDFGGSLASGAVGH